MGLSGRKSCPWGAAGLEHPSLGTLSRELRRPSSAAPARRAPSVRGNRSCREELAAASRTRGSVRTEGAQFFLSGSGRKHNVYPSSSWRDLGEPVGGQSPDTPDSLVSGSF